MRNLLRVCAVSSRTVRWKLGTVAVTDVYTTTYTTTIDTKVNYMHKHAHTSPHLPRELAEIQPNSLSTSVSIKTAYEGCHTSHHGQRANTSITQWMKDRTSHTHASSRPSYQSVKANDSAPPCRSTCSDLTEYPLCRVYGSLYTHKHHL